MNKYNDVIAMLEKKSAEMKWEYDNIQKVLTSLRGLVEPQSATPEPKPRRKSKRLNKQKFDWVKGRNMWDAGKSPTQIANALGCSSQGIYYRAKQDGWPDRPKFIKKPADRPKIPVQKCPHCGQMTNVDPCEMCHTMMPLAAKSAT